MGLFAIAALTCLCAIALPVPDWSVKRGTFVDAHGRERFFHGVNVVYKSAPYVPLTSEDGPLSFTERDAEFLHKLGMNAIRLGVMWGGVEPVAGAYNQTYVDELKKIVRMCDRFNIEVVLDFHQDSLSEVFCGEGIPWWAAHNYGPDYRRFPAPIGAAFELKSNQNFSGSFKHAKVPATSDCDKHNYNDYMASYAMARNYEDLYLNGRGLRDRFAKFWAYLAGQFKGDSTILGFELINEPASIWPRNYTESHFLQPMYDALAEAIDAIDPTRVILFEPVTWDQGYADSTKEVFTGLQHAPGGERFANRSIFAYHYYDFDFLYNADPYFRSRLQSAERMKVAGMVTEFMLEHVEEEGDDVDEHFGTSMDVMDAYLQSWLAWNYKGYDPAGYLSPEEIPFVAVCTGCGNGLLPDLPQSAAVSWATAKTLARTYAQAVQGHTQSLHFDRKSGVFQLTYLLDPRLTAPTVIYVNRELGGGVASRYEHGIDVNVSEGLSWSLNSTILTISAGSIATECEVSVMLSPKRNATFIV